MSIGFRSLFFLLRSADINSSVPHKRSPGEPVSFPVQLNLRHTRNQNSMVARCTFKSDDVVVKSPNDKRLYRVLELDNGLCALLVHDPEVYADGIADKNEDLSSGEEKEGDDFDEDEDDEDDEDEDEDNIDDDEDFDEDEDYSEEEEETENRGKRRSASSSSTPTKMAAAAMCVGVGSFSDPSEAQGLAHFLEHMLFMGSTEFPNENEYDSYLSKHGGSSNAYTETEHTCYHFEVKRESLKGALERFSQFFISPLVKMEAMDREILAVDSEFTQVMQNDACRLQQLQCFTSKSSHPFNRFVWGNKKSLADALEKGVNLRELILKMYRDWYHGGLMKLCVIGGESLDVLESWVTELFANVRSGTPEKLSFKAEGPIWETNQLYKVEAVKDNHTLELNWPLPCLSKHYKNKVEDYLAHLLGHEGSGSLLAFLKSEGLAMSLSAGVGDDGILRSSVSYVFGMSISLTDSGIEKIYDIISYVYQYLKLIKQETPQEWIFKELQDIGNMEFTFSEDQSQDDYAAELAENMLVYPTNHIIYGDYVYSSWDPDMINNTLKFLNPDNMRVDVASKAFHNASGFMSEPWFGTRFGKEPIPKELTVTWKDPKEIHPSLHLPAKNDFIPRDFSIFPNGTNHEHPKCLIDEPLMKIWYKLDSTFKLPRLNAYFRINLKGAHANPRNAVLTELFILLLKDELNEVIYQASVAKLDTSVALVSDKMELKVYGFNEKVDALLSKMLSISSSFSPTQDRFNVIKEDLVRNVKNANMKPLSHSSYLRLQVLCKCFYEAEDKLSILNELSLSDVKQSIEVLCSEMYIVGLLHGNSTEDCLKQIARLFKTKLPARELPFIERHKEQVINLPPASNLARDVKVKNPSEKNSALELYYQIEPDLGLESVKMRALIDLFDEIVEEPLFNQLRTKEQLGYVVECSPRVTYRVCGFCFCVQSAEYSPLYLQERVDLFVNGLRQLLEELDDVSFLSYKKGLIAKLLEKDFSLQDETNRHWNQIIDDRYIFDYSKREAEIVEAIEKCDVVDWYNTYLQEPSPKCRRLAIRVWGCHASDTRTSGRVETLVDDVVAFKAASAFYPSLC